MMLPAYLLIGVAALGNLSAAVLLMRGYRNGSFNEGHDDDEA